MKKIKGVIYQRDNQETIKEQTTEEVSKQKLSLPDKDVGNHASRELDSLAHGSARIILDIKAVFPFNFFPDEIIVDESKVSIHVNYFFYSKEVRSMEFKDIFNVIIQQGLFFARLEIVDRFFTVQPVIIPYLWKKDAVRARRIIQGMILSKKMNIDIHTIPIDELVRKLDRIGQSR